MNSRVSGDVNGMLRIYETLGALSAGVMDIKEDLKDIKENQTVASEDRQETNGQLIELSNRVGTLESQLKTVMQVTDEVTAWKLKGIGALFIVGIGASAMTWFIIHFADQLIALFRAKVI